MSILEWNVSTKQNQQNYYNKPPKLIMDSTIKKNDTQYLSEISLLDNAKNEHIRLFERQMFGSFFGSLLIAIIISATFWDSEKYSSAFYIWLFTILFLICFRLIQGYQFVKSKPNSRKAKIWNALMNLYTIGAGTAWGISPYIFQPETGHELVFTTLYSCGLIAAAVVSLSSNMRDFTLFSGCIAIFMVSFHITSDYQHSNISGLLFSIYFLVTLFFARNVSLMHNAADSLLNKNKNLINRLIDEKENAERSNKEKTRFIANASHDLRQPLHALSLYLDSLDNNKSKEDQAEIIKKSKRSLKSLDDLFSSLLDISNIDAGAITIAPLHFKLAQLFNEISDQTKVAANEKKIELNINVDDEICVLCDPVLSARCLRNIVINAIRHSECSTINLSAEAKKNHVVIKIEDNGKGIVEENLDIIFEEFQQLDNPHRDRMKGLGLGLTIVKRLLDLQNHHLKVESTLNQGTTFKIYLPYGDSTNTCNIRYDAEQVKKLTFKKSILIIDDEQQVLDGMKLLLNDWKQTISLAGSVNSAIENIQKGFSPDIIISDYRLQNNKTGADAINAIKSFISENTQIVFISGETEPQKITEIRTHGYPLIHKPVMGAALRSILTRLHNNPDHGRLIQ